MPLTIPSTAWSSAASSKMMFAALPPSSSVSFLPDPARRRWIALPTSVEPVNAILSTPASTSAAPARPSPVMMLTTPGGSSACRSTSQKSSAVRGVERQVDVARLLDRLAAVQRLEHRELARALREDARDAEHVLRALGAGQLRPGAERLARGLDGESNVGLARLRDLSQRLLVARRNRREMLLRRQPLAADVEAVAVAQLDDVGRLR